VMLTAVALACAVLALRGPHPLLDGIVELHHGGRRSLLVHLCAELSELVLSLVVHLLVSTRDGGGEVDVPPGPRILASEQPDLLRAAALPDVPSPTSEII
jgi:hypothetical protein